MKVTPSVPELDKCIFAEHSLRMSQAELDKLKVRSLIYQVEYLVGRAEFVSRPDEIDDRHFLLDDEDSSSIIHFASISWSMFGGDRIIGRGELLSDDTFDSINQHLHHGQVSFCKVYDAIILLNLFGKVPIVTDHWVGIRPLKSRELDDGIFSFENDAKGKTCLLFGDMYRMQSFSSICQIFVRYRPKRPK
jgi:hypothetical protein